MRGIEEWGNGLLIFMNISISKFFWGHIRQNIYGRRIEKHCCFCCCCCCKRVHASAIVGMQFVCLFVCLSIIYLFLLRIQSLPPHCLILFAFLSAVRGRSRLLTSLRRPSPTVKCQRQMQIVSDKDPLGGRKCLMYRFYTSSWVGKFLTYRWTKIRLLTQNNTCILILFFIIILRFLDIN